jgi:HK97 family phage prohead protease
MAIRIKDFTKLVPREFAEFFERHALELAFADASKSDGETRRLPFVASDDSVDLQEEVVGAGAFHQDIQVYARNPVLLAQHQHRLPTGHSPVIGSVRDLRTEASPFTAWAHFAEPPADRNHWSLYRDGHQRAFSVGFHIKDTAKQTGRTVITRGLLLEISAVPVPANSNALVMNYVGHQLGLRADVASDPGEARELRAACDDVAKDLAALKADLAVWLGLGAAHPGQPDADAGAAHDAGEAGDVGDDGLTELEQAEINACLGLE